VDLTTFVILVVFAAVYAGMALGRWPGLRIDRTGIAVLGAILLFASGAVPEAAVGSAIDVPTLVILFGLMILSAQFALAGFYDWCAARIAGADTSPHGILLLTVGVGGGLSAVLANDIVVFAMTPMLCAGLLRRGLDPRPFLIALACAANAGSAATLIGNPQNILIGQAGALDFWRFLLICGPPALLSLGIVHLVVAVQWRRSLARPADAPRTAASLSAETVPMTDRSGCAKAAVAVAVLLVLFLTPMSHMIAVLIVAAALLVSRRTETRPLLVQVDWPLLLLFAGLFVVTHALAATGLPERALASLAAAGLSVDGMRTLLPLALFGSNTIGNVPLVVLLLSVIDTPTPSFLYGLALLSTLAGSLLIVGSLANIIVVERARQAGVVVGLLDHARTGIPVTLLSMAVAGVWLWAIGVVDW